MACAWPHNIALERPAQCGNCSTSKCCFPVASEPFRFLASSRRPRSSDRYPFSGMAAAICVPYLSFEVIMAESKRKKWVQSVKTDSTHPPAGLFTRDAATIARVLASKKVSPKGPQSAMRMLNYFINRAGRGLSASRRAELQRARRLLSKRIAARRAKP